MNNQAEDGEREDIEMLLPWYASGTLDCAHKRKVEDYLHRHPGMSSQLDLIRAEREQAILANNALGFPSVAALNRLPPLVNRLSVAQRIMSGTPLHSIVGFFNSPTARAVRWTALVSGALILSQAAALTGFLLWHDTGTYRAASGQTAKGGVFVLVAFADHAQASAIAQLLAEFNASIVDGPKPGGVYKIRLRAADGSQSEADRAVQRLAERRELVRVVLPSRN